MCSCDNLQLVNSQLEKYKNRFQSFCPFVGKNPVKVFAHSSHRAQERFWKNIWGKASRMITKVNLIYNLQWFLFVESSFCSSRYVMNYQALEILPRQLTSFSSGLSLSSFLFFYVSMGFNRTSLLLCLYPRHIKTVSESPKCWRNPALFYGPVMMFPEREIKNYRFVGSLLHQGTLLSVIHNKRLNQSRWI